MSRIKSRIIKLEKSLNIRLEKEKLADQLRDFYNGKYGVKMIDLIVEASPGNYDFPREYLPEPLASYWVKELEELEVGTAGCDDPKLEDIEIPGYCTKPWD